MRSALVLCALASSACIDGAPLRAGSKTSFIGGGHQDSTDVAVVGIVDNSGHGDCTGTLIAPNVVLTAQHCVAEIRGAGCDQFTFGPPRAPSNYYVTTRDSFTLNPSDYHQVLEIRVPPGSTMVCGGDVAIMVLTQPIDPSEAIPIEARVDSPPIAGDEYSAVGFGLTSSAANASSGTRMRRDQLIVDCVGLDCNGGADLAATEWLGDRGVFGGDSGGPALDTSGRVIGVVSRGAFDGTFPAYALLTSYRDWIVDELARAAGPSDDAGVADAGRDAGASALDAAPDASVDAEADAGMTFPDAAANEEDAASDAGADAAIGSGDAGARERSGCDCSTYAHASDSSALWFALALLLALARARARARARSAGAARAG